MNRKYKPILQYDLKGNFIKEWTNVEEIVLNFKTVRQNFSKCLNNKQRTAEGFKWKYKWKKIKLNIQENESNKISRWTSKCSNK